jgi:hypothetical protein
MRQGWLQIVRDRVDLQPAVEDVSFDDRPEGAKFVL